MTNIQTLVGIKESKIAEIKDLQTRIVSIETDLQVQPTNTPEAKTIFAERAELLNNEIVRYNNLISQIEATIVKYDALIAELNGEVVEVAQVVETTPEVLEVAQVEKSVVEVIADQLYAQGYTSEVQDDSITVYSNLYTDYDLSITVVENGFAVETYNNHSIEHFKTYEWANYKVVKTLRGLNGYLRRFGFGTVAL